MVPMAPSSTQDAPRQQRLEQGQPRLPGVAGGAGRSAGTDRASTGTPGTKKPLKAKTPQGNAF